MAWHRWVGGKTGGVGKAIGRGEERMRFSREVPVVEPFDLVVCGGGPAGVPAALAARRAGL